MSGSGRWEAARSYHCSPRQIAAGDGDGAEAGLGARVVGEQRECVAILLGGRVGVARLEQQRRQLHARPLRVLGRARAGVDGPPHQADGTGDVALQLARVAEAGIGDEARPQLAERANAAKPCW